MNIELLKKLCAINGVTGSEASIGQCILDEIKDFIDDYKIDALGNVIAHKKGDGKKMMLAGHMDQIGFMITHIDENGFLRFATLGGINPYATIFQRVSFPNGVFGVMAVERVDDLRKDFSVNKMYIDIGASDKEAAEKLVRIGDTCTYCAPPVSDDIKVVSPALDDRIGCFIMIEALKQIKNSAFDLYFVFTAQEEIGLRGAKTSAYSIEPDYGLAFDVSSAFDTPKEKKMPGKLGGGAAIKLKDSSLICHPKIVRHLTDCAEKDGIKHQFEILEAGGTDAGAIQSTKSGVPSGGISIITRYIHSACEMCLLSDIDDCIALTVSALETSID